MSENSPNLLKNITLNIQEVHQTPSLINSKRFTLRYITTNLSKVKDKETIVKAARKSYSHLRALQ